MNITKKPALYFSSGRQGNGVDAIVVHWIVGTLESADAVFSKPNVPPEKQVSAHYGVGDGEIHQYVYEPDTAWHCGDWLWNLKTVGIEHEGGPDLPISDKTYETSAELIRDICERHGIPMDREHILPHKKFKATQCPGTLDIDRLISLAKGEDTGCEGELEEMRGSRDYWKGQSEEGESTIRTEREDCTKDKRRLNERIEGDDIMIKNLQAKVDEGLSAYSRWELLVAFLTGGGNRV